MKNITEKAAALEAILFASGEPVDIGRLCSVLLLTEAETNAAARHLSDRLDTSQSGIKLIKLESAYQLCTREKYLEDIRLVLDMRKKTPLSGAAMEVLAVIAYNQPVTKAYVEQVRGVDCSGVVSTLVEKRLIEEKGRLELPGRPLIYGTTDNFLRCFSLSSLSELPKLKNEDDGQMSIDDKPEENA